MRAFIVQARLNFDDPVVGVYASYESAKRRAKRILRNPNLIDDFVDAIDVTGLIGVAIYRFDGTKKTKLFQEEFGDAVMAA